jgi:hypothetical protein
MKNDTTKTSAKQKDKYQSSKHPLELLTSALLIMKVTLTSKGSGGSSRKQELKLSS